MAVTIILQAPNAVTLQNVTPASVTINKNVVPTSWGEILGTLSNQSDLQIALDAKENIANKSTTATLGTSDVLYPSQNAVKTYVDTEIGNIPAPTTPTLDSVTNQGSTTTNSINVGGLTASSLVYPSTDGTSGQIIQTDGVGALSFVDLPNDAVWGNITGTLSSQTDVQNALNAKENTSNKSTTTTLGTSNTLYPSQNAVKTYVDNKHVNAVDMGGVSPTATASPSEYAVATYVQNEIAQAQSGIPTFEIDMFANYKIYESDEDGTTTYVGTIKATNGNWLITKYVDNSGDITATYANESNNAAQTTPTLAWTNRAALTYAAVNDLTSI
tara:strand:- start:1812 stop:2798 length:987 start_codon:yes stop_codon:yes gene_type:complete